MSVCECSNGDVFVLDIWCHDYKLLVYVCVYMFKQQYFKATLKIILVGQY